MLFVQCVEISNACWWGQRTCNWPLIMASLKQDTGFLDFLSAFGRIHYLSALPAMLRDLGKLGDFYSAYLELGALEANLTGGDAWKSLSDVTEAYNWLLKHFTPYLDADGQAWVKTSINMGALTNVFMLSSEIFGVKSHHISANLQPNVDRITRFRKVVRHWKALGSVDTRPVAPEPVEEDIPDGVSEYFSTLFELDPPTLVADDPEAITNFFTGEKFKTTFLGCKEKGSQAVNEIKGKILTNQPGFSLGHIALKVANISASTCKPQSLSVQPRARTRKHLQVQVNRVFKETWLAQHHTLNYPAESPLQLCNEDGEPHHANKSTIRHIILREWEASVPRNRDSPFEVVAVDFMQLVYKPPPQRVKNCTQLAQYWATQLSAYLNATCSTLVVCFDKPAFASLAKAFTQVFFFLLLLLLFLLIQHSHRNLSSSFV